MNPDVSPVSLVVGAGGLLGSATTETLYARGFTTQAARGLAWSDHRVLADQFHAAVAALRQAAADRPWAIYWCAGVGHVGSDEHVHQRDQAALQLMLDAIAEGGFTTPGVFLFASSAGGVYSGNHHWPAHEGSPATPIHGYGESKLHQEAMIEAACNHASDLRAVHLRISNLYGAGQAIGKPQGLLSHLIANTFGRVPSTIYVPLDTSRDYLFSTDAAAMSLRAARLGLDTAAGTVTTRILAAERNHTIAQILGILSRIVRRRVPIIARPTIDTGRQPLMLSFRSQDLDQVSLAKVSIEEGISRLVNEYAQCRSSAFEVVS